MSLPWGSITPLLTCQEQSAGPGPWPWQGGLRGSCYQNLQNKAAGASSFVGKQRGHLPKSETYEFSIRLQLLQMHKYTLRLREKKWL